MRLLLVAVMLTACATVPKRAGRELPAPVVLPLSAFMKTDLRTVNVSIGGAERRFLFDTGGGVTVISPELAKQLGCEPAGRLTAHRMSGERIDAPRCAEVPLALGGVALTTEAVVMDLAALMPPDWEKVHGLISLQTLESVPFTLDLAKNQLTLETPASLDARVAQVRPVEFRVARPAGGAAVDLFVKVDAKPQPLWLIVDSGNIDRVVLAPHAARALGRAAASGSPREELEPVELIVSGSAVTLPAVAMDLIYDGNLGTSFLNGAVLSVDLPGSRVWLSRGAN